MNQYDALKCDVCGGGRHTGEEHRRLGGGMALFQLVAHRGPGLSLEALDDLAKLERRQEGLERAIVDALTNLPVDFQGQVVLNVHIAADGTVTVERQEGGA